MQSSDCLPRSLEALLTRDRQFGNTLAFETSGRFSGLAILVEDQLIAEAAYDNRRTETEHLLEFARALLSDHGLSVADLSRIAFSEGPGSFTGLRVGMAIALGIAAGADLPVVPVPTLEVLAYPWREIGLPIVVASGLRRGHLYLGAYLWSGQRMEERLAPASRSVDALDELLAALGADDLLLVGDAVGFLPETIEARLGTGVRSVSGDPARASHVALLALDPLRPSWTGLDREGKTPRYLRDADARKPTNRSQGHLG